MRPADSPVVPSSLRILLVAPRYAPYSGGVETHTYEVARRLANAGNRVTVLTTDPEGRPAQTEQIDSVQIRRVPAWRRSGDAYFAPGIYGEITRGGWDIIHCQGYNTLVTPLAMLGARHSNTPYLVTFHSGGHSSRLRNALRGTQLAMLRPLLRGARRLVAVSTFEEELFRRRLRLSAGQTVVIPNGCTLPRLAAPAGRGSHPLIVSVGRLERYKGHHRVIAALPRVLERRPDVRLQIVGAGPYRAELERLASRLGVSDRLEIRSVPADDREEMARLISQASLVTLLSEYESHGLAALEALSLGRPVLVTDAAGLRELARRGLARAVPLHSAPERVAEAILEQLRQPPRSAEIDLPTWDACAAELLALYQSILAVKPCAS